MRGFLVLSLVIVPSLAGQQTQEALAEIETRVVAARAELAQSAFDDGLLREAGTLVRDVLAVDAEHAISALLEQLKAIDGTTFAKTYERALEKRGKSFRRRARKQLAPLAKEVTALGDAATKAGDPELAERTYLRAVRIDPDNKDAARALRKLDYDVVFNYGVIPKAEKQAARKMLRALGGSFLSRVDLTKELEFWNDAWGLDTRHYRFVTNSAHATVFAFAQACEDLHPAWEQFMKGSGLKVRKWSKPLTVFLFDSHVSYETILRVRGQDPSDSESALGFYSPTTKIGYFYEKPEFYEGNLTLLFETFWHEGAHQLIDLRMQAPWKGNLAKHELHWVEEGFAVYLESLRVTADGKKRSYTFGEIIDDDLQSGLEALATGDLKPSADFVHTDFDSWDEYEDGYPHAVLLVHYLLNADDGKHRKKAFQLLYAENTMGGTRKETLFEMLKTKPDELDAAIRTYALALTKDLPKRAYD